MSFSLPQIAASPCWRPHTALLTAAVVVVITVDPGLTITPHKTWVLVAITRGEPASVTRPDHLRGKNEVFITFFVVALVTTNQNLVSMVITNSSLLSRGPYPDSRAIINYRDLDSPEDGDF